MPSHNVTSASWTTFWQNAITYPLRAIYRGLFSHPAPQKKAKEVEKQSNINRQDEEEKSNQEEERIQDVEPEEEVVIQQGLSTKEERQEPEEREKDVGTAQEGQEELRMEDERGMVTIQKLIEGAEGSLKTLSLEDSRGGRPHFWGIKSWDLEAKMEQLDLDGEVPACGEEDEGILDMMEVDEEWDVGTENEVQRSSRLALEKMEAEGGGSRKRAMQEMDVAPVKKAKRDLSCCLKETTWNETGLSQIESVKEAEEKRVEEEPQKRVTKRIFTNNDITIEDSSQGGKRRRT